MGISSLSASLENPGQLQARILIDVDVGVFTFLGNGEVFTVGMHGDRADTISVSAVKSGLLLGLQVVRLVLVSCDEDDFLGGQEVQVVTLH